MNTIKNDVMFIVSNNKYNYTTIINHDIDLYNKLLKEYGNIPIKEMVYCVLNDLKPNETCKYGHIKQFVNMNSGYSKCNLNRKCLCLIEHKQKKAKQTNLKKYGTEYPFGNKDIQEKIKQTNLERYGTEHVFQTDNVKEKTKQTNLERYGVENASQHDSIKNKIKKTNLERYGTEHVFQTDNVKEKTKQTNLERYGVENYTKTLDFKEKTKQTKLTKYGDESYTNIEKMKQTKLAKYGDENYTNIEKTKQTNLEKYGVEHPFNDNNIQEKAKQTNLLKYDSVNYMNSKKHYINMYNNIHNRVDDSYTPLFINDDYNGVSNNGKGIQYTWECKTCNNVFNDHLNNGRMPRCPTCCPHNQSKWELELQEYISQYIDIETNTKQIINPFELDIYIPNKNLAIECNGSYWHSENNGKHKKYHLNKTELCNQMDIQLLHIWEHEYMDKPDLVKSLIKSKLGLNGRIYARKTNIKLVDNKIKDVFLEKNHMQGTCISKYNIGLYYNNELVALMTFGEPRFNKKYEYELIRYCSKQNMNIIGGSSKLFKYFIKTYEPNNIISYADRRYSNGNMYKQLEFNFIENTNSNYKYTKDYKTMYNRVQFQKHKLKDKLDVFDTNLTESQNMYNNGYDKLWDCGNSVWEWKK